MTKLKILKDLYLQLDKKYQNYFWLLIIFTISCVFLEAFSITLIPLFIAFITEPSLITDKISNFGFIEQNLNNELIHIKLGALFLIVFFIIKSFIFVIYHFLETKFFKNLKNILGYKILTHLLNQNYKFHTENEASYLQKNCIGEVSITVNYIRSWFFFFKEITLSIFLFLVLLVANTLSSIIILVILVFLYFVYTTILKKKIIHNSEKIYSFRGKRNKFVLNVFNSVLEIKIYNRIKNFASKFLQDSNTEHGSIQFVEFMNRLPKIIIELIIVFALSTTIIFMVLNEKNFIDYLPIITLFVLSIIRLHPSIANLISLNIVLSKEKVSAENYLKQVNLKRYDIKNKTNNKILIKFNDCIELKNISFSYKDKKIFKSLNLKIKKNTVTSIIGESGIGKSTLIKIIIGLIKPDKGEVYVDKKNIQKNLSDWQNKIAYIPQKNHMFNESILDNIVFYKSQEKPDKKKIDHVLNTSKLNTFVKNLKKKLDSTIGDYGSKISGGQLQRIGLARALYQDRSVLIFDEATNSLDQKTERAFYKDLSLLKKNKTIIIISHGETGVKFSDHVLKIKNQDIKDFTN